MKSKHPIHPNSVPKNSPHVVRTKGWCQQIEKIVLRVYACEDQEEYDSVKEDAFSIRDEIAKYGEQYLACDTASRRLSEAFNAPSKIETLERLAEVAFWLNSVGLSPYLAAK